ncbi:hypothetical protein ASPZODRAFT_149001 [Penicilliopsis zonata CBS 506.65]|uniref:Hcy-binding domain-containing protein n=1 Tax=Penicilliopsis zonata CBS 506.65 TaxID=1073090 RepID=A0A1L9SX85_9EURO|nr:hypothetical protein ASPZODRAFT_149001 [Penicilliopsis zonata CBS 506.65]OJJ51794.1 hypothetical protein ASPZODRAFT_149001 [Penicilliopsis zonata CBS 506.65]
MSPVLLLDGGLGTTLEADHGIRFSPATPLWSSHLLITNPSVLRAVHAAFAASGADIVMTGTYQASIEGFLNTDAAITPAQATGYMRAAVDLAREAFPPSHAARVALSLGPYGAVMHPVSAEYAGDYPAPMDEIPALRDWHAARLRLFAQDTETHSWDKVEFVALETVKRVYEVTAIRAAVGDVFASLPSAEDRKKWWVCGVFPTDQVDEEQVRRWIRASLENTTANGEDSCPLPRPWGVGLNCTRIENVPRIMEIMEEEVTRMVQEGTFVDEWQASATGRPWLVVYPDGTQGERYDPSTKQWVKRDVADTVTRPWEDVFWETVQAARQRGLWEGVMIGGCCRTGPKDIAALRRKIDSAF